MSTATKLISASNKSIGKPAEYFYYTASKIATSPVYDAALFEADVRDPDNITVSLSHTLTSSNYNYYSYAMTPMPAYNGVAVGQPQTTGQRLQFRQTRPGNTTSWTSLVGQSRLSGILFDEETDTLYYSGSGGLISSINASNGTSKGSVSVHTASDYFGLFFIDNKSKILAVQQYSSTGGAGIANITNPNNLTVTASNITISNLFLQHPISQACVYDDANDRLWATTNAGLRCYTYNGSNAFTLTNTFDHTPFFGISYRPFCLTADFDRGLAFVSSELGLAIYDISDPANISQTATYNTYRVGTHKYDPVGQNIFSCHDHTSALGGVLSFDVSDSSSITLRDRVVLSNPYTRFDDAPSSALLFQE